LAAALTIFCCQNKTIVDIGWIDAILDNLGNRDFHLLDCVHVINQNIQIGENLEILYRINPANK
jgi:hypothetical protein